MSVPQFAAALEFYTTEEAGSPNFRKLVRGITLKKKELYVMDDDLIKFWMTVADSACSNTEVASSIRDPFVRYIRRIIACTVMHGRVGKIR
ncbi:hypothetical protein Hanom_Chr03g00190221 [Helianthus anomalus]